jgi:hypothetical protein
VKIYFTASSTNKQFQAVYQEVVKWFEDQGHEVFGKVLWNKKPKAKDITKHQVKEWLKEWSEYINECDLVVIEGTYPSSLHVGFELGVSLMKGKPTVLIYQKDRDPILVDPIFSSKLIKSEYDEENLIEVLGWCLEEASKITNRRFTFYIDSEIESFLDQVVDKEEKSRSEYIRNLIKKEMK